MNYAQDKPIVAPFAGSYADMSDMFGGDTPPQDSDGYSDDAWFDNFLTACRRNYDEGRVIAPPYDSAVACTFYRQDLFEAHTKDFDAEYGYRLEFTPDTTWKQVFDIAKFFKAMPKIGADVPYGCAQHQGSFAWTKQLDLQRLMFSHGRWIDFPIDDKLGSREPGPANRGDEQSVLMLEKLKELGEASHPDHLANGTLELNTV